MGHKSASHPWGGEGVGHKSASHLSYPWGGEGVGHKSAYRLSYPWGGEGGGPQECLPPLPPLGRGGGWATRVPPTSPTLGEGRGVGHKSAYRLSYPRGGEGDGPQECLPPLLPLGRGGGWATRVPTASPTLGEGRGVGHKSASHLSRPWGGEGGGPQECLPPLLPLGRGGGWATRVPPASPAIWKESSKLHTSDALPEVPRTSHLRLFRHVIGFQVVVITAGVWHNTTQHVAPPTVCVHVCITLHTCQTLRPQSLVPGTHLAGEQPPPCLCPSCWWIATCHSAAFPPGPSVGLTATSNDAT